jgi:hypothetical protein
VYGSNCILSPIMLQPLQPSNEGDDQVAFTRRQAVSPPSHLTAGIVTSDPDFRAKTLITCNKQSINVGYTHFSTTPVPNNVLLPSRKLEWFICSRRLERISQIQNKSLSYPFKTQWFVYIPSALTVTNSEFLRQTVPCGSHNNRDHLPEQLTA